MTLNCLNNCNFHGKCVEGGICECDLGWRGIDCGKSICDTNACNSDHGECVDGACLCRDSKKWIGLDCSVAADCEKDNHGLAQLNGLCKCNEGWTGELCEVKVCLNKYIHTYIHMYIIHTYIYTYIHTYILTYR